MMNSSKLMVLLRRRRSGEYIHADLDLYVSPKMRTVPVRELGFIYPSLRTGPQFPN